MNTSLSRGYARDIVSALTIDQPRDSIARVKDIVIKELNAFDQSMAIRRTDFFNHSFAPDLILSWPKESTESGHERPVFLRVTDDPGYLAEGLDRLRGTDPIVLGLAVMSDEDNDELDSIRSAAESSGCLVTDPAGLEILIERRAQSPVLSLLSNAIAQGGLGLLGTSESNEAADVVASGFEGARELAVEPTRHATELLARLLDRRRASRMNRFLQAVWVGRGGDRHSFPGPPDSAGELSDEALEFLLNFAEIDQADFWRSIGRDLSVARLSGLRVADPSPNLQHSVRANLDRLWARGCAIVPDQVRLWEDRATRWVIDRESLALRTEYLTVYCAENAEDVNRIGAHKQADGIDLDLLRQRSNGLILNSLRLSDGRDAVAFDSELDEDVARSNRLRSVTDAFGPGAMVQEAQVVLPSGQHFTVDFRYWKALGLTASRLPLGSLVMTALRLLSDVPDEMARHLEELLKVVNDDGRELEFPFMHQDDAPPPGTSPFK